MLRDFLRRLLTGRAVLPVGMATPAFSANEEAVLGEWYARCVAKYKGAHTTSGDLWDGFAGQTCKGFCERNAAEGVHLRQGDMERYLATRGHLPRNSMSKKHYDGLAVVMFGDVTSGNYMT